MWVYLSCLNIFVIAATLSTNDTSSPSSRKPTVSQYSIPHMGDTTYLNVNKKETSHFHVTINSYRTDAVFGLKLQTLAFFFIIRIITCMGYRMGVRSVQ